MEFADGSDDEQMPEEVELISKRPLRATAPEPSIIQPGSPSKINVLPSNGIGGFSGKWPIGVAFLIICVVALSTGFSMIRNLDDGEQGPYSPIPDDPSTLYTAPVTRVGLAAAERAIDRAMEKIESDWRVSEFPIFKTLVHIPATSWDLQVHKFITKLLEKRGPGSRYKYVAVFTGSSVTAGHDNYISEMFSAVFDRVLSPVFESLNMELETRNVAIGNNPCIPYDACVAAHAGTDADLVTWEQSMNCGRQPDRLEFFIRSAIALPKKPTIFVGMSGTPAWTPDECGGANESARQAAPRPPADLSAEERLLAAAPYRGAAEAAGHLLTMPFLNVREVHLSEYYKSGCMIGVNVLPTAAYKCRGPYNRNFCTKSPGLGKPWHPGTLGHQLRGDIMAYAVLAMLRESVQLARVASRADLDEITVSPHNPMGTMLQNSRDALEAEGISSKFESDSSFDRFTSPLKPVVCPEAYCAVPPKCYTDFEPRYLADSSISHLVVGSEQLAHAPESARGESARGRVDTYPITKLSTWNSTLAWTDIAAVLRIYSKPETHYGDLKRIMISDGNEGSRISMRIEVIRDQSPLWLCELNLGVSYPPEQGRLPLDARIFIKYGVDKDAFAELAILPENQLGDEVAISLVKDSECFETNDLPNGLHMVTVVQGRHSKPVNLAYVLHW